MGKKYINTLMYDITMNCNLRCIHCYNNEFLDAGQSVEIDVREVIDGLSKIKFTNIVIQGGEPLLVKNLEKLIEELNNKDINVFITTNATLLTKERVISLIKAGTKGIYFSIESASQIVNDRMRGVGTYSSFYKNVKNFMNVYLTLLNKKYIPPMRIELSCTASSINFSSEDEIRKIFNLAEDLKIEIIRFNFLQNFGGSKNLIYNEKLTNFEIANMIAYISKEFPYICVQLPMKQIEHEFLKKRYGLDLNIQGAKGRCPAGENIAYVDSDLNIYPCAWLIHLNREDTFTLENKRSLYGKIPENLFSTFINYKKKCVLMFEDCKRCRNKNACIPKCPCLKRFETQNKDSKTVCCPTKKEIGEYKK